MSQINPVHKTPNLLKIHFTILIYISFSSHSLSFILSLQTLYPFHVLPIPRPYDPPLISYRNQYTRYLLVLYPIRHWTTYRIYHISAQIYLPYIRKILFLIDNSRYLFLSTGTHTSVTSFSHMTCTPTKSCLCFAYPLHMFQRTWPIA